ncbi:hypothetical protein AAVH_14940 [Aphelenchoides avenae]|nr:hypothetical protein AAVH_14940 [Aphelenchus avenae]
MPYCTPYSTSYGTEYGTARITGYPWVNSEKPRRWDIVPPSLWIAGIRLLRSCELFEVDYESHRKLRPIARKLVQLCEKFERGEITELVRHFKFSTSRHMTLLFKEDNKTASDVRVADYEWDVYRFRNAATADWLTACVGQERSEYSRRLMLHIVKGEVYPDASFGA